MSDRHNGVKYPVFFTFADLVMMDRFHYMWGFLELPYEDLKLPEKSTAKL